MTDANEMKTLAGEPVRPLGLAGAPDSQSGFAPIAYGAGVNFLFFYGLNVDGMVDGVKRLLRRRRDEVFVATGTESRDPTRMRDYLDAVRETLDVDAVDLFFVEYVSPADDLDDVLGKGGAVDEIRKWKDEGRVRYVGATAHSRPLSLSLIESGRIQVLMHRYNMAHRKSEDEVLPAAIDAGVPVVAFTCTRWGSLLEGHADWPGQVPSAADCYRFVLRHPAVHVALTAPATESHLRENLTVLSDPREPAPEEMSAWKAYGDLVYGEGGDAFETRWP
ncbi:MAG: aldo/keto reductase [Gemmatimonadota bacterium]|nr:aldo/keto reductase [Gemmatimonadota bacterium]